MFFLSKQKAKGHAQSWLKDANIYQLFVGRVGKGLNLSAPGHCLDELCTLDWKTLIQQNGFNLIYLLGIFDNRGPIVVTEERDEPLDLKSLDRVPSPFAISDHMQLNPLLGSRRSFSNLVSTIHSYGAKVMVDYVANHTAINHPWVKEHPEYYVKDNGSPTGLRHEFSGDVVKLDYGCAGLAAAQLEILRNLQNLGVDGIRCDMAHLIPISFWERSISDLKSRDPGFALVAEAYSDSVFSWKVLEDLLRAGFDAIYHEFLYRNLRSVFVNRQPLNYLVDHINFVLKYEHRNRLVHYLANHDDPLLSQCVPYQEALMALLLFMPGTAFVYNGQLNGFARRLKHHRLDLLPHEYAEFNSVPAWFQSLMRLRVEKRPLIVSVEHSGGGVLRCPVYVNGQLGTLVLNLGEQSTYAPVTAGKGILRGLTPAARLDQGQAELFL